MLLSQDKEVLESYFRLFSYQRCHLSLANFTNGISNQIIRNGKQSGSIHSWLDGWMDAHFSVDTEKLIQ